MTSGRQSKRGSGPGRVPFVLALTLVVALAATWGPPPPRFQGTYESEQALVEAVLGALEENDREKLERLALSRDEFQKEAFPEMPAYGNIPEDFVWEQLELKSHYGLSVVLDALGGQGFDYEGISYPGGKTEYDTFVVHRKPILRVRDRATGRSGPIVLFGSILEYRGRFKLFSFNIDR